MPYALPKPPKQPLQAHIRLTPTAWNHLRQQSRDYGYEGRSIYTGTTHYLLALMRANPTDPPHLLADNWGDNRPHLLTMRDKFWLPKGRFPLWGLIEHNYDPGIPYQRRILHSINAQHFNRLLPDLARLSMHFLIAPTRSDQANPRARCVAVLEAIGLRYLVAYNDPPYNPRPPKRRNSRPSYSSQERLVF